MKNNEKLSSDVEMRLQEMRIDQLKQNVKKKSYMKKGIEKLSCLFTDKLLEQKEKELYMRHKLREDLLK